MRCIAPTASLQMDFLQRVEAAEQRVGIKLVHMVFIRSPLGRLSLCAGAENEVLKAVEEIRVTVSGEPSGLEKNKV